MVEEDNAKETTPQNLSRNVNNPQISPSLNEGSHFNNDILLSDDSVDVSTLSLENDSTTLGSESVGYPEIKNNNKSSQTENCSIKETKTSVFDEKTKVVTAEEDKSAPFECNICLETASNCVLSLCGHLFCWSCLHSWLQTKRLNATCPVCKSAISRDKVIPVYGRGNNTVDPRTNPTTTNTSTSTGNAASSSGGDGAVPPRPAGQRTEIPRGVGSGEDNTWNEGSFYYPSFTHGGSFMDAAIGNAHQLSFGFGAFPFGIFSLNFLSGGSGSGSTATGNTSGGDNARTAGAQDDGEVLPPRNVGGDETANVFLMIAFLSLFWILCS